jgi:hypothetical protein
MPIDPRGAHTPGTVEYEHHLDRHHAHRGRGFKGVIFDFRVDRTVVRDPASSPRTTRRAAPGVGI